MTDGGATPDCKRLRREDAVIELSPQRALNRSTSPPRSPPRTHRSPSPSRTTAAAHPEQAKLVADLSATYGMPMPAELATVWVIAKKEKAKAPLEAFTSLGVRLVGPFEVLSGDLASNMDVHMHWRYAHDTPEMMTILTDSTTNRPSKHWCYHRDSPADLPTMVVLARQKAYQASIEGHGLLNVLLFLAREKKLNAMAALIMSGMEEATQTIVPAKLTRDNRYKASLGRPFHKLGMAVPYNRKTQVGYRSLGMDESRLKTLAQKMQDRSAVSSDTDEYSELCTFVDIANDEGDFGHSLEVGLDLFCLAYPGTQLQKDAHRILDTSYMLLGRHLFRGILTSHMNFHGHKNSLPVAKYLKLPQDSSTPV